MDAGVHVTACKACSDQLGVTQTLEDLKIEVKYWGAPLTEIIAKGEKLLNNMKGACRGQPWVFFRCIPLPVGRAERFLSQELLPAREIE